MTLGPVLSLVLVALALRLIADLTSLRLVPVFRFYLAALIVCVLYLGGNPTPAWMGLATLSIKVVVTIELVWMLFADLAKDQRRAAWIYSAVAGLIVMFIASDMRQQANLTHRDLVYVRQIGQVLIATTALAAVLQWWVMHRENRAYGIHGLLLAILWMAHAVIGIARPADREEWEQLRLAFNVIQISCLAAWIYFFRPGPSGGPSGGGSSLAVTAPPV